MRKIGKIFRFLIPVIALVALVVFMTGAGRRERAKVEELRALARRGFEAWNTGNMDLFDEVYAPDLVRHEPGAAVEEYDLDAMKQAALSFQKDYTDLQFTMDEHIIGHEFDRGLSRWTLRGTHTSGVQVTFTGCTVSHLGPDGKIVEEWVYADWLGLFQQFGFKLVPAEE